ncbi:hypothetical protein MarSH_014 [Marseillevirus Shanghai 1]|nr:hypothetical protein MarSH_014 [Marseillevirus Shanghai 1]
MSFVQIVAQQIQDYLDIETMCSQEREHFREMREQERRDWISIELMCVQQQIEEIKRELQELLDMDSC